MTTIATIVLLASLLPVILVGAIAVAVLAVDAALEEEVGR
jgi:hypothetical protein